VPGAREINGGDLGRPLDDRKSPMHSIEAADYPVQLRGAVVVFAAATVGISYRTLDLRGALALQLAIEKAG
jgi:hypothetical protein